MQRGTRRVPPQVIVAHGLALAEQVFHFEMGFQMGETQVCARRRDSGELLAERGIVDLLCPEERLQRRLFFDHARAVFDGIGLHFNEQRTCFDLLHRAQSQFLSEFQDMFGTGVAVQLRRLPESEPGALAQAV